MRQLGNNATVQAVAVAAVVAVAWVVAVNMMTAAPGRAAILQRGAGVALHGR
jgi:hypothetical protein